MLGGLLKSSGLRPVIQKLDPYLNIDAGTMNPTQHGEVFVTDDGAEVDLDLGHYERFIDENLTKDSSVTMGQVYGKFSPRAINEAMRKIALFANLQEEAVISMPPMDVVYEVPIYLSKSGALAVLKRKLGLPDHAENLSEWEDVIRVMKSAREAVKVAIVGKYMQLEDSYISLYEALKAAGVTVERKIEVESLDSALLESNDQPTWKRLRECSGIIVPGGFGTCGMEGKIAAAKYARENRVPYLGICLGMHIMAIALARQALGDDSITSQEFDSERILTPEQYVIHYLPGQQNADKGGSMRLGGYDTEVVAESRLGDIYGIPSGGVIRERHRHRLEFNNAFRAKLQGEGVMFSGIFPQQNLVEVMELKDHPFMIGVQYHPELISRPTKPHPLFVHFLQSAILAR